MKLVPYKDYTATAQHDRAETVFHGRIAGIQDLATFESDTEAGLQSAFEEAVDSYLDTCAEIGKQPQQPLK